MATERTLEVGGHVSRWLEDGDGPPVVLVHGIPTSPQLWRRVTPLVRGRTLAWEMRGYGKGIPDAGGGISVAAQARHLLDWLGALGLPAPPVLVGHDLGGGVAQIAAVRSPGSFAGLVLTNAICYDSWPIPRVKAMRRLAPVLRHLPAPLLYPAFAQLVHQGHDDPEVARASLALHWGPYADHGAARALLRQIEALHARDTEALAGALPGLGLPAEVVWGAADSFQKIGYGERLARDLGARLTRIPGGRHFTPEDHPEQVAAAINRLLPQE